jgi:hypothetical protein
MPALATIPDVELITVGMDWPGSNGDLTFRFDHLEDAVIAANEDPHIQLPRIKIGHTDPRFNTEMEHDHDPFWVFDDGEPALGSIENLRLENSGSVLVGDFVRVPLWLAEIMPAAYPSRSIEGAYIDNRWRVVTPGGKEYSFVLTAVALLGIFRPACEDLEDREAFLTEGDGVEYVTPEEIAAAAQG